MATFIIHSFIQKSTFEIICDENNIIVKIIIRKVGELPVEAKYDEPVKIEGSTEDSVFRVGKAPPEPSKLNANVRGALSRSIEKLSSSTAFAHG